MTVHSAPHTPDPRLNAHPLPAGLRERLRLDHGWSERFAEGAEREYRRFVYLAAHSGESVTPSQAVDEVWHTHLVFTRDYWGGFQALLPGPLHHDPGTGQAGEDTHFRTQYLRTLELYARTFGEEAPALWWPRPGVPEKAPRPTAAGRRGSASTLLLTLVGGAIIALMGSKVLALGVVVIGVLVFFAHAAAQATPGEPRKNSADGGGSGSCGGGLVGSGGDSCGDSGGGSSCGGGCGGGCGS